MPIIFRYDEYSNGEAGEDDGREVVDGELPELNHEPENAGERAALSPAEPGRVHFHHARRAEGLKVTVEEPNRGKGAECAGEGCEAEDEIDRDRPRSANEHRGFAANAIGKQTVDELTGAVGDRPRAEHSGDLECAEAKIAHHARGRETEIVTARVIRGIEQADDEPV